MRYLFIHQNFPGQFRHIASALANDIQNEVVCIGTIPNLKDRPVLHPRIILLGYECKPTADKQPHVFLRDFDHHIHSGQAVASVLLNLKKEKNYQPDVVMAHPGWGESLFLRDIFPTAKIINYYEYYYQSHGGDVGFDPDFPSTIQDDYRVRIKNSTQLQTLVGCDMGISPTQWQKSRYPPEFRNKIQVIHEGIDTDTVKPDANAWVTINGQRLSRGDEIITYAARNLEPYRGFHVFMRSLPRIQALRPHARVIIVGGDHVSYGKPPPQGQTYRQLYCEEVKDQVDWGRVSFVGKLSYPNYLSVLQVSALHVYLTYPFVLSWSMLEAMSAGCLLLGSATEPVKEVIEDGQNGFLTDFFDHEALAQKVSSLLDSPAEKIAAVRRQARQTIVNRYDLKTVCLPQMLDMMKAAA